MQETLRLRLEGFHLHYVIVANGTLREGDWSLNVLDQSDVLVAVDGGYNHLLRVGRQPDLLIGDLDSIAPRRAESLRQGGIEVLRHPERKDANDLELALKVVRERGATRITLLGLLGSRWDQSLANLLLLADEAYAGIDLQAVDGPQTAHVIQAGRSLDLSGSQGDLISLIPIRRDAHGVQTSGLEYPLEGETLAYGSSRGVSNVMRGARANVKLESGVLLCLHIRGGEAALQEAKTHDF